MVEHGIGSHAAKTAAMLHLSCCVCHAPTVHVLVLQELGTTLQTFSDRVNNLAQRVNPIPPMRSMTSYFTEQLNKEASQLAAVTEAMPKADGALTQAIKDSSARLQRVLDDITSQEPLVPSLLKSMAPKSLRTAVEDLSATADNLENEVNVSPWYLFKDTL